MYYLRPTPNPGGAYGAPQSSKAPGLLELPDSLLSEFLAYNGFVTLTDHVEFLYKADNYYAPEADGGIRWNDPELGIDWGVTDPVLSEKDTKSPFLKDAVTGFEDW